MNVINPVTIGENRYAPDAVQDVALYNFNGAENLTLGQLVLAVCINRAAAIENQSVTVANHLAKVNEEIEDYAQQIEDALASYKSGADEALAKYKELKNKMDTLTTEAQQLTIDLSTLTSRRDVAYNTGSSVTKTLGDNMFETAGRF